MIGRLRGLGIVLGIIGFAFVIVGAYAFFKVQEGSTSLNKFSEAQGVQLNYNEEGQLIDRGETAGAEAIMALLTDDWGYPVVAAELDPADPVVNTASEYMYQMAVISYHTLHGETTVVLPEDVEYNGEIFKAGEYTFVNDGRYWTGFDRMHPIEGPARSQIWTGVAHALIGELGVGTVTAQALQLGLALAGIAGGLGGTLILTGAGLVWATRGAEEKVTVREPSKVGVSI